MTTNYTTLKSDFSKANIHFSIAFSHGLLTAYCCKNQQDADWVAILISELDLMNASQQGVINKLNALKNEIAEQLADAELSFQLPLDDTNNNGIGDNIHHQALTTREWVSGYWLGIQQLQLASILSDEHALEFIHDLEKIAIINLPDDNDQDTLADLIEIQEYCRMGAIGLYLAS